MVEDWRWQSWGLGLRWELVEMVEPEGMEMKAGGGGRATSGGSESWWRWKRWGL